MWLKKNTTGVDVSDFAKKADLPNSKSDVDKLDIDNLEKVSSGLSYLKIKVDEFDIGKLETTPVDLSKLKDVIKDAVIKMAEFDELIKTVTAIQTTDNDLVKRTDYNTKINEIENKILDHDHDKYVITNMLIR